MKRLYRLIIPISIITVAAHAEPIKAVKYTIKKGESLSEIAKKKHIPVNTLCKANGLSREIADIILNAGQVIKIPLSAHTQQTAAVTHKEKKKSVHISRKQEHRLAQTLVNLNAKTVTETHTKKAKKFTLSDIIFDGFSSDDDLSETSKRIIDLAKSKLGKRYVWGAVGRKNTFDCSGLTRYVCNKNGIHLPRRAIEQSKYGKPVQRSELQPGDLVFFDTSKRRKGYVNHVGIYIGDNKFIHASSAKKKVVITSMDKPFYSQRFKGARRVVSLTVASL